MNLARRHAASCRMMARARTFRGIFRGHSRADNRKRDSRRRRRETRRSLGDSVHKLYDAGMFVLRGFKSASITEKKVVFAERP